MSFNKTGSALRDVIESLNDPKAVKDVIQNILKEGKISADSFSIREVFEACYTVDRAEAVSSDLFSTITGELISSKVMAGYDLPGLIGDLLCETVPSKLYDEKITGLDSLQSPEEVLESSEYNESFWGEKYVTARNIKYGRLLAISMETIMMDRSREIFSRAMKFGEKARLFREKLILNGIQDLAGFKSYFPSGVETALFSSVNKNLNIANPIGSSGIDNAWEAFSEQTDSEGDPILVDPNNAQMIVPIQLWRPAQELSKSVLVPDYPYTESGPSASNIYKGTFTALTSPFINQDQTTWFFGNFKKAFVFNEVIPIETLRQKPDTDYQFKRDIEVVLKIRLMGSLSCVDPKYVCKNTG